MELKGKYYIDRLNSFYLGNPDVTQAWKHTIANIENGEHDVAAFRIPRGRYSELVVFIEKMLQDKLKDYKLTTERG